uniref:Uncharacterized protein n=1 Tax=Panagrellus redivivus TaxID=6233 RepID=A0A7E4VN50_PANRE
MTNPFPYPYLINRESQLIELPSGPIELPAERKDGNTVYDNRSNVENAAAVPTPLKAHRQPTARGMGKRIWKQNCRTPWKARTPFENFADLVDRLMQEGATPYRLPFFVDGKVRRYYRCGKCDYFGLSYRHPNPSKLCILYETRIHCHDVVEVDPKHRHLYFEVPDELNSDDKATDHDETADAMEVDNAMIADNKALLPIDKAAKLDFVKEDTMEVEAPSCDKASIRDFDLVREVFGEIDPTFKGYEDLKNMICMVIRDAPKPPRRRKQAHPMKIVDSKPLSKNSSAQRTRKKATKKGKAVVKRTVRKV